MTDKMILCEGRCSLKDPYAKVLKDELDIVHGFDIEERHKLARQAVTEKLKLTRHRFQEKRAVGAKTEIIFQCCICGNPRTYGAVARFDQELRSLYLV